MNSIKNVCDFLLSGDNYLIIMHDSPDGDTVGAGYGLCRALRQIGKSADCACGDKVPDKYSYMTSGIEPMCERYDRIVTVDVADIKLIKEYGKRYEGKFDLCIDHHSSHAPYANCTYVRSDAAAACEIIFDVVLGLRCDLTMDIARCLYTGISTDTGCFRYSNVTPNTHVVAAALMRTGIDTAAINRIMFETKSFEQIKVENMAIDGMDMLFDGKCAIIVLTKEMQNVAPEDDLEGIKAITRQIKGVQIGVTMREKDDGSYKVSIRSNPPYSASDVCRLLGGGGHMYAAGCEVNGPLNEAKATIINAISEVAKL